MKKIIAAIFLLVASMSSYSAEMECRVSNGSWNTGWCDYFDFSMTRGSKPAYFRVTDVSKPISQVIWQNATASCSSSSTSCSIRISPYRSYTGSAIVLYADGTYENVSASAYFETGF